MTTLQELAAPREDAPQNPRETFRQRTFDRLQAEGGERPEPEQAVPTEVEPPVLDEPVLARDEAEPAAPAVETPPQPTEEPSADLSDPAAADETALTEQTEEQGEPSEPEEGSAEFYRLQAERAEQARQDMEKDFRFDSAEIAEVKRDWETKLAQTMSEAEFYSKQAENALQQKYAGVNWEALKADPANYQKAATEYQRDLKVVEETKARRDYLLNQYTNGVDEFRKRQVALSQKILKKTVPGWNNDRLIQLREFAEANGLYTGKQFDEIVDWQSMYMLDNLERTRTSPAKLTAPRKQRGTKPRAPANKAVAQSRNAKGQFERARKEFWERPGDRTARRSHFMAKLAAEREGRR